MTFGQPTPAELSRFISSIAQCGSEVCWEWQNRRDKDGYGRFKYRGRTIGAHRAAYEFLKSEPIPSGMCVLHTCDNPPCCNPRHLFVGSVAQNNADRHLKGRDAKGDTHGLRLRPDRVARGERAGLAKMDEHAVRKVFALREVGWTQASIAEVVGVSRSHVSNVLRGAVWRHLAMTGESDG